MKATLLSFGLIATVSANIVFNHVPLSCDIRSQNLYYGCLEGQNCTDDGTGECYVPITPMPSRYYPVPVKDRAIEPRQAVYSTDGTCGPANGNTICDPKSTVYKGSCCSSYGWCGNDDAHCGAGCLSGCTSGTTTPSGTSPRSDGRCGSAFGGATCDAKGAFGGCCSSYGYCGSTADHCLTSSGCQSGCTDAKSTTAAQSTTAAAGGGAAPSSTSQEPVIAPVTSTLTPAAASNAPVTTDGSCGTANGGTVCGNWPNGNCCSMYGFCGNTNAHCGAGCQSGNCLNAPVVPAPGASPAPAAPVGGAFNIVGQSGVPAMHAALMPNGRVMFLDKLENYTQLRLPNGNYAMSSEYDPASNGVAVPLAYKTNAFCSGGTFLADGRVVSLGGNAPLTWLDPTIGDGFTAIRYLERSSTDASLTGKDWSEPGNKLASARWYATAQTMGDGTIFVASGSLNGLDPTVKTNNNPTYEILSATAVSQGKNIDLEILEKNQPYYMYPFVHLLNDGTLFIFVSKSSQIFNVGTNTIVKELPELAGDYRTYPNTGGSVLLPLSSANQWNPDIVICGGGAYQDITSPTEPSCGRIQPLSANPTWELDSMPEGRGMVEGTLLPDGTVIWLNGGNLGAQGFGLAKAPTLEALLYDPTKAKGQRFSTLATSTIPRLYHSVSLLLMDGTLMVAGSNPVEMPKLKPDAADEFVTEFRVENYVPPYLSGDNANKRPTNVKLSSGSFKADGSTLDVTFDCPAGAKAVTVTLYHGGFVTHSVHMGHRMLHLDNTGFVAGATQQKLTVTRPPNNNVAPPGPYVVYILVDGIPAMGQFVTV